MSFPQRRSRGIPLATLDQLNITASPGSVTITGTAANLNKGFGVAADAGSVNIIGTAASLLRSYLLTASPGSVAITGTDATLIYTAGANALSISPGLRRRNYIRAFHPALSKPMRFSTPVAQSYTLIADPGSITITGTNATLTFSGSATLFFNGKHRLWPRPFAPSRRFAQLRSNRRNPKALAAPPQTYTITASPGSVTITGTAATLRRTALLTASAGSVVITGTAANLNKGLTLVAAPGSVTITGTAAALKYGRILVASAGTVTITGTAATLIRGRAVQANSGSVTITGADVTFRLGHGVTASPGSVVITGTDVTFHTTVVQTGAPIVDFVVDVDTEVDLVVEVDTVVDLEAEIE